MFIFKKIYLKYFKIDKKLFDFGKFYELSYAFGKINDLLYFFFFERENAKNFNLSLEAFKFEAKLQCQTAPKR